MSGGKKKGGDCSPPVARRPPWETIEPPPEFLEEVAEWFRHPQGKPWPSTAMIRPLAQHLLFVGPRGLTFEQQINRSETTKKWRKNRDKSEFSQEYNIIESLIILKENIPNQISKIKNNSYRTTDEYYILHCNNRIMALEKLFESVCQIEPLYEWERNRKHDNERAGRRRYWLKDGNWIYDIVIEIWGKAGRTKPLGSHRTGPLVGVLVEALRHQGFKVDSDAIAKWLESRKQQGKKQRANSSDAGA
ncbi:hypothetical protein [Acidiphilium sp.]|jgi:hypothetical protein|uniref:hypothetical protein n=1 Tax=Acidiphilium sp. TaxID=527 RepID=UPI00258D3A9E|nr:hypothetical protein [Acidiphilium sp.]